MIPRRFVFNASASAFGGFLFRPEPVVFDVKGASALSSVGGRSSNMTEKQSFPFASFERSETATTGSFREHSDVSEPQRAKEDWNPPDETMHPRTSAFARLEGLTVGNNFKISIASLTAHLTSQATAGYGESAVRVEPDTHISPVIIGNHTLIVELDNKELFQKFTTRAQVLAALEHEEFIEKHGDAFFMKQAVEGERPPAHPRLANNQTIYATIVKRLVWKDDALPGAVIDHNMVIVPNVGRIFFGELLIKEGTRRLSMVRFKLGSPVGGGAGGGEAEDNGQWLP